MFYEAECLVLEYGIYYRRFWKWHITLHIKHKLEKSRVWHNQQMTWAGPGTQDTWLERFIGQSNVLEVSPLWLWVTHSSITRIPYPLPYRTLPTANRKSKMFSHHPTDAVPLPLRREGVWEPGDGSRCDYNLQLKIFPSSQTVLKLIILLSCFICM